MKIIGIASIAAIVGVSGALATPITLNTGVLPSDQGWTYAASGVHAGVLETDVFSAGGQLNLNSLGLTLSGLSGGSILCRKPNSAVWGMPAVLEWTSRTLGYEKTPSTGEGFGFLAGFKNGNYIYQVGISSDKVTLLDAFGFISIPVVATNSHTYRIDAAAGSQDFDFYIDNVLKGSATAKLGSGSADIYFGDGTGGANANTDITSFEFRQIPEPSTLVLLSAAGTFVYFGRRRLRR